MKAKSFWKSVKSFKETSWNQQHIYKKIQTQPLKPLDISSILFVDGKKLIPIPRKYFPKQKRQFLFCNFFPHLN